MGFVDVLIAPWRTLGRGDVAAIFLVAAFISILVIAVVELPILNRPAEMMGFGPDWECRHPGYGEPVCVKKPPPSP